MILGGIQQARYADADPVDVILRQDLAFGRSHTDYDLWMTTLQDPVRMLQRDDPDGALLTHAETRSQIGRVEKLARADGVVAMRTRILTHLQTTEDMAIVASMRDMLSEKSVVLSTTSMTWTLQRSDDEWRITQIFFEGEAYSTRPELRGFKQD